MQKPELSATIIDDEEDAREILSLLLNELFPFIRVDHQAHGVSSGMEVLTRHQTDLLFLDVEMCDGSGFDLLDRLSVNLDMVIFVTAFDKYAIKALRASAFDYILKPVNREELQSAVNRALGALAQRSAASLQLLKGLPAFTPLGLHKIALPDLTGMRFVETGSILRCEADGNYAVVHFTHGKKEVVSRSLGQLEEELVAHGFFRIHHKHLVNLRYVTAYQKGKAGGSIRLNDNSEVEVSIRRKAELLRMFS